MPIDFATEIKPLVGSNVAHAWKGYGSVIFLELGTLTQPKSEKLNHPPGRWRLAIEWDWRLESGTSILLGSSNTGAEIANRIGDLEGSTIESIDAFGDVPELLVSLSTGYRIRTTAMVTGDPSWSIKLSDSEWLYVIAGKLRKGDGRAEATAEEANACEHEAQTAKRWGTPMATPTAGSCYQCSSFVRLDGHSWLLDYGVCTADNSPMDGNVVNRGSGCPQFTPSNGV